MIHRHVLLRRITMGLAMATATVFQANGCTMGVDNLDSMSSLLGTVLENSDVSISINSSPRPTFETVDTGDFEDFGFCDCYYGF